MRILKACLCLVLMLFAVTATFAQPKTVTGKVVSGSNQQPLPGVSIYVKGTSVNTTSDADGSFSIQVSNADAVLVFSLVGYQTQEQKAGAGTLAITLAAAANQNLEEVVVVGYGTVRRKDLTGAVASVKSDVIVQAPTHNAIEAIQGRVAGMDITRSSGAAGSGATVNIRGIKSLANRDQIFDRNGPLVIIDGFQGGDLSTLNSNDIESIEVLKDASSTSIYGAQGGNGVIIVTTKRGASGKIKVNYSGYYGVNTFMYPKVRIGQDYINLRREAFKSDNTWTSPADDAKLFPNLIGEYNAYQAGQWVDWIDLVSKNGTLQSHNISLTSGTDKTKVFLSAGYFNEQGLLQNQNYKRYNVRFNLDQNLSKVVKAGISSQLTYSSQNNRANPLGTATQLTPLGQPYDANGNINIYPLANDTRFSPLIDERTAFIAKDNYLRTNVVAGAYIEIAPIKGLTIRSNFSTTLNFLRRGVYNDKTSLTQINANTSTALINDGYNRFINWDNVITYNKKVGDHAFTVTGITSFLESQDDQSILRGTGVLLASQQDYGLAGATSKTIETPYTRYDNMAYAARLNYTFKGKYVLYASGRYDGSSRLSPGHKWQFFPSAGLGWNISDEQFFEKVKAVDNLKLRATYGVAGNYNIQPYATQSYLSYYTRMSFGEVPAPAYIFSGTVGNPELEWEKTSTLNIGLDFSILNKRVTGTVDWFRTTTKDILVNRNLPQSTGMTTVAQNIASTRSTGIEIAINTVNIQKGDFKWTSTVTFTSTSQKITDIIDGKNLIVDEKESWLVGYSPLAFYTYIKEGIWQTNEADKAATIRFGSATGNTFKPGDIKLKDISGPNGVPDGIIDATYDRTFIGSSVPKWYGGLQNNFNYKNFDLGIFLFFRFGQTIEAEYLGRYNPSGFGNGPADIDYWTPSNPTNDFPQPRKNENIINYAGYQTLRFVDGSYFKIKNITLGYTLPKKISQKIGTDNIRFYATGSNVLTITRSHLLSNYDPERGGQESSPIGRQYVFGVNVGF